jgi:hypothetical protein
LYPAEFFLNFLNTEIGLTLAHLDIFLLTDLTDNVKITVACISFLVVDIFHHLVSDVSDAFHIFRSSSNVCQGKIERILAEFKIVLFF